MVHVHGNYRWNSRLLRDEIKLGITIQSVIGLLELETEDMSASAFIYKKKMDSNYRNLTSQHFLHCMPFKPTCMYESETYWWEKPQSYTLQIDENLYKMWIKLELATRKIRVRKISNNKNRTLTKDVHLFIYMCVSSSVSFRTYSRYNTWRFYVSIWKLHQ